MLGGASARVALSIALATGWAMRTLRSSPECNHCSNSRMLVGCSVPWGSAIGVGRREPPPPWTL
jgi:hypothetical protein